MILAVGLIGWRFRGKLSHRWLLAALSVTTQYLQVDDLTLRITSNLPAFPFSLAYAWRETPVKRFPLHNSRLTAVLPGTWGCLCTGTPHTSVCPRRLGRRRAAARSVSSEIHMSYNVFEVRSVSAVIENG